MRVDPVTDIRKEWEPRNGRDATLRKRKIVVIFVCTFWLGVQSCLPGVGSVSPSERPTQPPPLLQAAASAGRGEPQAAKPLLALVLVSAGGALLFRYWARRPAAHAPKVRRQHRATNPFQPVALKPEMTSHPLAKTAAAPAPEAALRQLVGSTPPAGSRANGASNTPTAENFIYAAAHDLREPLRKVRLFLSRLEQKTSGNEPPRIQSELDGLRLTVNRMQSLLDSLLSLARIEGRGVSFELTELSDVLKQVLADLETTILETNAEVSIEGSLPQLAADRTQLQQLLQNLLSNALKFRKPGTAPRIRITVSTSQDRPVNDHPSERSWCEIAIRDEGIGFESAYWEQMLQGFQRLNSRDQYEGTGLGLAICRCIIERHQGRLAAESVPGQGTTVRVSLPIQQHARSGDTTMLVGPALAKDPIPPGNKQY